MENEQSPKDYRAGLSQLREHWAVAEIKVSYQSNTGRTHVKIGNALEAYLTLIHVWDMSLINLQEQFAALFLNTQNEVIGFRVICTGDVRAVTTDVPLLVSCALGCRASNVIIAHNHPSGCLMPSPADDKLTEQVKSALGMFSIHLHDHLIMTATEFHSYREADSKWLK